MKRFALIFIVLLLLSVIGGLGYGYFSLSEKLADLELQIQRNSGSTVSFSNPNTYRETVSTGSAEVANDPQRYYYNDCVDCEDKIREMIDDSIADLPQSSSQNTPSSQSTPVKTTQTSYVPLGTTASSTSTDWYTIDDSSAFIDLKNDFSESAYVTFEASLKVKHGNGQAFARLWDDTNKIAVIGSEISTSNNMDYQLVKSGRVYLWNGNNNYKVQLKSLNGFEVTFTNGKVKVVY